MSKCTALLLINLHQFTNNWIITTHASADLSYIFLTDIVKLNQDMQVKFQSSSCTALISSCYTRLVSDNHPLRLMERMLIHLWSEVRRFSNNVLEPLGSRCPHILILLAWPLLQFTMSVAYAASDILKYIN